MRDEIARYEDAVEILKTLADKEYVDAYYGLGLCYEQGVGVERDIEAAKRYYSAAADKGHDEAKARLEAIVVLKTEPQSANAEFDLRFTDDIFFSDFDYSVVDTADDDVFTIVDEPATFQGGDLAKFRNWVMGRVSYPASRRIMAFRVRLSSSSSSMRGVR